MSIYLGLGSNLGERKQRLADAIRALAEQGINCRRASPVIESPALLDDDAPWEWNRPFLNMVIEVETSHDCHKLLRIAKEIESTEQRDTKNHWAPRPIDIDILLWGDQIINTETLTIPHNQMHLRHFVLTPLLALAPNLVIPGLDKKTVLQWTRELKFHAPLWMGILNVTPDSFSDGGKHTELAALQHTADDMYDRGAAILDIGGESTRPGADTVDPKQEWQRISPFIEQVTSKYHDQPIKPWVSVDTRNPYTAEKAIECGVEFINDVSGLSNPAMLELASQTTTAKHGSCEWIAMHSLSVPADLEVTIKGDVVAEITQWLETSMNQWSKAGIDLSKVIFDPGVGFGKDPLQSLKLLQSVEQFRQHGLRILIGHSRKSFMKQFTKDNIHERDQVTIGASMQLCHQHTDIIRVHNIKDHLAAYRGWSHLAN